MGCLTHLNMLVKIITGIFEYELLLQTRVVTGYCLMITMRELTNMVWTQSLRLFDALIGRNNRPIVVNLEERMSEKLSGS